MATSHRPKRVVIVDADNPMVEVEGDFFWREDHEALVTAARAESYRVGFEAGWADAVRQIPSPQAGRRRRGTFLMFLSRRFAQFAILYLAVLALGMVLARLIL